jgi:hypothetical protein
LLALDMTRECSATRAPLPSDATHRLAALFGRGLTINARNLQNTRTPARFVVGHRRAGALT